MHACARGEPWQNCFLLLEKARHEGLHVDAVAQSSAMIACSTAGRWASALALLLELCSASHAQPDLAAFNAAAAAACGVGVGAGSYGDDSSAGPRWELTLALFAKARCLGLAPDVTAFGTCFAAYEKAVKWEQAVGLLSTMQEVRVRANVVVFNTMSSALEKAQRWQDVLNLLRALPSSGLAPDATSFGAAASACARGHGWSTCLQLLDNAARQSLADVVVFNASVWACDKARQWRSALGLMGGLRGQGLQPDVLTVNSCLSAYAQVRHWLGALALMRTMVASLGLRTDAIAFNAAILACSDGGVRGQWPRVLVLLSRMACEAIHS
ncbi:unnamed protein product, partial [Polarella glacialis]